MRFDVLPALKDREDVKGLLLPSGSLTTTTHRRPVERSFGASEHAQKRPRSPLPDRSVRHTPSSPAEAPSMPVRIRSLVRVLRGWCDSLIGWRQC